MSILDHTPGGEMGARIRAFDWAATTLGPVSGWPPSLLHAAAQMLSSKAQIALFWGPDLITLYNDAYRPVFGSKHPWALGVPAREAWSELWPFLEPVFTDIVRTGEAFSAKALPFFLERHGFAEETYFDVSYDPVRDASGRVAGIYCIVNETTGWVLGERRLRTLRELGSVNVEASASAIAEAVVRVLAGNPADVPYAAVQLGEATGDDSQDGGVIPAPPGIDNVPAHARPAEAYRVVLVAGGMRLGTLVTGLSRHLALEGGYSDFLNLVGEKIAGALSDAQAFEVERRRAEALAELDRAKTAFFSNVSHELRTPLTLILGPVADALQSDDRTLREGALESVHRNAQRLLKLVDTLLNFSRLEAGRLDVAFEPVDLAALTSGLASSFHTAMTHAGVRYTVDCAPLPQPVYVDRQLWETIVLNLVSNAFKFTLEGAIDVSLSASGSHAVLRVRDTGVGIPADALPRIFERFFRAQHERARTHEGTGIGLALVHDLVSLHGGTIAVDSTENRGTCFTVRIPFGHDHVPAEALRSRPAAGSRSTASYVDEAMRWIGSEATEPVSDAPAPDAPFILVADDNHDMREYLRAILGERWVVETVDNGAQALAAARARRPDVLVTDVMMPGLDGFGLLRAIRDDGGLRDLPVVVLSAKAGEEARLDGLAALADDYIVKPFSSRELVRRVDTQLRRSWLRAMRAEQNDRLVRIFNAAPVGVAIITGAEHVFEFANAEYVRLTGNRPLVGRSVREVFPELAGQGVYELLDAVFRTGLAYTADAFPLTLEGPEGPEERLFRFIYQPLRSGSEEVTGIAAVVVDVTELAAARRDAEAASRAKDEFLAMLGHELRNPLAPILTALQLMRLKGVEGAARERQVIERQVSHVVGLVDDLLDVSRITRGKIQLSRTRCRLADVVAEGIEIASPLLEQRNHALTVDVAATDLDVDGDAKRLAQVIANLLTNAAKYTEPGGRIAVRARRHEDLVVLQVTDSGIGIDPAMLPRIFDLFTQERQAVDRAAGGLGLGLAIVRSLVALHGGTVDAFSEGRGCGSVFTVSLPAAQMDTQSDAREGQDRAAPLPAMRILVVDDNADAAILLAEVLSVWGLDARVAADAPQALAIARDFRPDVALLDIGLPVVDGYELARELRQLLGTNLRLMAVTGYGQPHDRGRALDAGFEQHLTKPVDLAMLRRALARVVEAPS